MAPSEYLPASKARPVAPTGYGAASDLALTTTHRLIRHIYGVAVCYNEPTMR